MYLLDFVADSYNQLMAIVNFICFGGFMACCVLFYLAAFLRVFDRNYSHIAISTFVIGVVLFVVHYVFVDYCGITLLVPPVDTVYFTEFIHIIQYIASVAFIGLGAGIFVLAPLSRIDHQYSRSFTQVFIFFVVVILINGWILSTFNIPLIFPPNLW